MESAKAIPLISIDESTGEFRLERQGRKFFESHTGKIGILCVAGLYRTGKSFLLNLLSSSNAFTVDSTVEACTRGFQFCQQPLSLERGGERFDLFILDCEGLGGIDKSQNYDVKIFTMAMLLSSYFVYNSVGVIDETAINNLSMVTQLSK